METYSCAVADCILCVSPKDILLLLLKSKKLRGPLSLPKDCK